MKNSKEILKLGLILGLVCLLAGFALSATYSITKDKITEQQRRALVQAQKEIFPDASEFKKIEIEETKVGSATLKEIYECLNENENLIGYIATASTPGYGGSIIFVLGINNDFSIKGVKVTEQTETPGLGANIAKPSFLEQFIGKTLNDEFVVKKDIEPITSATISSRSITNGVKEILNFTAKNLEGMSR